jgi:hypothetical protein
VGCPVLGYKLWTDRPHNSLIYLRYSADSFLPGPDDQQEKTNTPTKARQHIVTLSLGTARSSGRCPELRGVEATWHRGCEMIVLYRPSSETTRTSTVTLKSGPKAASNISSPA